MPLEHDSNSLKPTFEAILNARLFGHRVARVCAGAPSDQQLGDLRVRRIVQRCRTAVSFDR
jgi:hypothetical protein